jgi:hypothetical protein
VRLGSGQWLQAALLALQLLATEERGMMAPAAPVLANGNPGRSGDGELAPGEAGGGGVRPALTSGNSGGGARLQTVDGDAALGHGDEAGNGFGGSGARRSDRRCRLRTRAHV